MFRTKIQTIFLMLLFIIISGCTQNKFEYTTTIEADVNTTSKVSLNYMLGDILVLDTIDDVEMSKLIYLAKNNKHTFELKIEYETADCNCSSSDFYYYIKNNLFFKSTPDISNDKLLEFILKQDDVTWYIKDGKKGNLNNILNEKGL